MPISRTKRLVGAAVHPGDAIRDELDARGMSAHALSIALRLPASRIGEIVRGRRAVTPETALRLARYFGNNASFWLRLQAAYDLSTAEAEHGERIAAEIQPVTS
ncbi:MAG: HigA family addiction module antidote protein [Proteobacteria bacterium]|nr:HigA family addiction module antidote protein [Pseudomonadota bacterium]MBI3498234.1 HigA family addiction module antidote protein [Pseudomonadota bacterium]